jgi:hypothetical protein
MSGMIKDVLGKLQRQKKAEKTNSNKGTPAAAT